MKNKVLGDYTDNNLYQHNLSTMSNINTYPSEALLFIIKICAENLSNTISKNMIASICKDLEYKRENVPVFKLIFENPVFYPLPNQTYVFISSCTNGLIELVECLLNNMLPKDIPKSDGYSSVISSALAKGARRRLR